MQAEGVVAEHEANASLGFPTEDHLLLAHELRCRTIAPGRSQTDGARMIGGVDIAFTGSVLDGDMDVLLRAARAVWPDAFVESGDGSLAAPVGKSIRERWLVPTEAFVYESRAAYESWTISGLTEDNADKMVAITLEADCISFVVGDTHGATAAMVSDMIEAVRRKRWLALAAPAA